MNKDLLECGPITDLFAEGIDRVEVLGQNIRVVYWRWKLEDGVFRRVALDFAVVRPLGAFDAQLRTWTDTVQVVTPGGPSFAARGAWQASH